MREGQNFWQFTWIRGSARFPGVVEASSEERARALAQEWCDSKSVLLGGSLVTPMILARESTWAWRNQPMAGSVAAETPTSTTTADHTMEAANRR